VWRSERHPGLLALLVGLAALLVRLPVRGAEPELRPPGFVDLHADLSYQHVYKGAAFASGTGQYPARDLLRAGVVGVVLPLFVPNAVAREGPRLADLEHSYRQVFDGLIQTRPYALPGCRAPAGTIRTWLAFEGAAPFASRPSELAGWVARGVRSVGLVHTHTNALATSSSDGHARSDGLTKAGLDLVRVAHALGVSVDVSHASRSTVRDVVRQALADRAPVIATHSNARALAEHPRNLDDDELRAIASTGGIVGVNFHTPFLARGRVARLSDLVAHVRHLVRVMGVDHVAFGSDFEGGIRPPPELASVRDLPKLAEALERSGLSRSDVERIFGKNALRLLCRQ
jgi:membrane dipeptidase